MDTNQQAAEIISVRDWVLVKYENGKYPGEVICCKGRDYEVSVMYCRFGIWKWPENEDKIFYDRSDILKKIKPPVPVGSRGQFIFENLE